MSLQGRQRTMTDMLQNESSNIKRMKIEYTLLDDKKQPRHAGLDPKPAAQHVDFSASLYAVWCWLKV